MRKKRPKKQTSDDRARDLTWLEAEPEHGCQIFRKKLLCGMPTFVILSGPNGSVGICIECWERLVDIAADAHVDTLELRSKYVAGQREPPPSVVEKSRPEIPAEAPRKIPRTKSAVPKGKCRPAQGFGPRAIQGVA